MPDDDPPHLAVPGQRFHRLHQVDAIPEAGRQAKQSRKTINHFGFRDPAPVQAEEGQLPGALQRQHHVNVAPTE